LGDRFLWAGFLKIAEVAKNFGNFYSSEKNYVLILPKMSLATFWAIFSQAHLVTLLESHFSYIVFCCRNRFSEVSMADKIPNLMKPSWTGNFNSWKRS
jgi:hypothetical protein